MRLRELPADVVTGAVVFAFAVVVLVASLQIPEAGSKTELVGPKALPVTYSVTMAVAALALLGRGLWVRTRVTETDDVATADAADGTDGTDEDDDVEPPALPGTARRLLVLAAMLLAYILVFIPVGYLLSTFVFLGAVSTYIDRKKWVRNLVFAALFAVVVYFAFTRGLQVELPPGILG